MVEIDHLAFEVIELAIFYYILFRTLNLLYTPNHIIANWNDEHKQIIQKPRMGEMENEIFNWCDLSSCDSMHHARTRSNIMNVFWINFHYVMPPKSSRFVPIKSISLMCKYHYDVIRQKINRNIDWVHWIMQKKHKN